MLFVLYVGRCYTCCLNVEHEFFLHCGSKQISSDAPALLGPSGTQQVQSVRHSTVSMGDAEADVETEAPSIADVCEYARHLGIDPIYDSQFLWVAQEALQAPLPEGWLEVFDDEAPPQNKGEGVMMGV